VRPSGVVPSRYRQLTAEWAAVTTRRFLSSGRATVAARVVGDRSGGWGDGIGVVRSAAPAWRVGQRAVGGERRRSRRSGMAERTVGSGGAAPAWGPDMGWRSSRRVSVACALVGCGRVLTARERWCGRLLRSGWRALQQDGAREDHRRACSGRRAGTTSADWALLDIRSPRRPDVLDGGLRSSVRRLESLPKGGGTHRSATS
jgi:hypothetical protein